MDEASLALNVIDRDVFGLFKPLDYFQGAPPFFLAVTKLLVTIFGDSEPVLRLFPLFAGVVSLVLFYFLAKSMFNNRWLTVVAVAFFSLNARLIYFSQEFKQYSSDVMFSLAMLLFGLRADFSRMSYRQCLVWGTVTGLCLWFSHPLIFTVAGVLTAHIITGLCSKNYPALKKIALFTAPVVLSFGIFYLVSLNNLSTSAELLNYWTGSFLSLQGRQTIEIISLGIVYLFHFASFFLLIPIFMLVGAILLLREEQIKLWIVLLPIMYCIAASLLQHYPFNDRFILFLLPLYTLLLVKPLEWVNFNRNKLSILLIIPYVMVFSMKTGAYINFANKNSAFKNEDLRPVLLYVQEKIEKDDTIYLYYGAERAANYYFRKIRFDNEIITGICARKDIDRYFEDLQQLEDKKRVWVILSHYWEKNDEIKQILNWLVENGQVRLGMKKTGALALEFTPKKR